MRFQQIRYLEAIVRLKSFRRAARELRLSEPSLSQQIRKLESELGAMILHREPRAVGLTDFGTAIMPHALAILNAEEQLHQAAGEHHGLLRGHVLFGTVNAGSNMLLPHVLSAFNSSYPGIDLRVTETGSLDIADAVLQGRLDMGVIVSVPEIYRIPEGLHAEELLKSSLVICAPARHPLLSRHPGDITAVAKERLILFRQGYLMHEMARALLREDPTNVIYYTDNTESAKRMVAAGIGITILPEFSVVDDSYRREGQIGYIRLTEDTYPIRLCLVYRANGYLSRAARVFCQMLREAANRFPQHYASSIVRSKSREKRGSHLRTGMLSSRKHPPQGQRR